MLMGSETEASISLLENLNASGIRGQYNIKP